MQTQKVPPAELRKFFGQHRGRHQEPTERRLEGIGQAMPAIRDRAVLEAKRAMVQVSAQLLRILLEGIANLDSKIEEAASAHPDFSFLSRCPERAARWRRACWRRLAPKAIAMAAPRRYRRIVGSRPVMEKSGKKKWVHFRWACPKFLRQSFHEWAGHSISQSTWARAYYQQQRGAEAKTTTRRCAPWLSNGFASYFDAGKIE